MTILRAAAVAALFLATALPRAAFAEDVTLTSPDGAVSISGDLLGFDGQFYRVDTQFGELTVDGSGVSCEGPGCPNLTDFVAEIALSGSSTMAEILLPALFEGFALRDGYRAIREDRDDANFDYVLTRPGASTPAARFSVHVSNTEEGFADLLTNEADIVMAVREIRPAERDRAYEAGLGDMTAPGRSRVLALDAVVALVAPENPVQAISTVQLARVFSGEIANWSDLGGPDAPISLHLPADGSGFAQAVEDQLLGRTGAALSGRAIRYERMSTLARAVAGDPFALGLGSFAEAGPARALTLTGPCGFGLNASRTTIKTEDYPLTAPMFLYLPARRLPQVGRDFLSYLSSPSAQIVIRRAGFVDRAPETIPLGVQGDRLANAITAAGKETPIEELQRMVARMRAASRLTTSFRFEPGSARPDAQSRANIEQLAQALEAGQYDARALLFVGFSDGQGPAAANRRIALKRALAVRDAVLKAATTIPPDRVELGIDAFGEALPMACDDSDWGRKVNRRVEIWLR